MLNSLFILDNIHTVTGERLEFKMSRDCKQLWELSSDGENILHGII